ncbi:sortase A [Trueperella bonasi]|uniref:Sortase A n=1 Tax=Trueperella bonasi TaxID=312286 RepID=A0ABT9NGI7_9ACTO|nr:class C sortase [Trueperella bonasi]MDP9806497.1 sortase A [Trueperella bonasi]
MPKLALNYATALLVALGATLLFYPAAASWFALANQTQITAEYSAQIDDAKPEATLQLSAAREYNSALSSGVLVGAWNNLPEADSVHSDHVSAHGIEWHYEDILSTEQTDVMARLRIQSIDVDIPVYHGTEEDTLLKGAGHLEGTAFPVGGESTRSVITAHRGLANATMFTNLDKVVKGDTFVIEVFGETFTYSVIDIQVVPPEATEEIQIVPGEDLVTLITCTPLGINTHRILVTGERVIPTPASDLAQAGEQSNLPRFPWWAVAYGAILLGVVIYLVRSHRRS